jgi:drug/metabolite transporter (DMT)-like permease
MAEQKKAYFYALVSVLLWSTVAAAFKLTLRYFDPLLMLLYSALVSTLVLGAILVLQNKLRLLKEYGLGDYLRSIILGGLNPFLYYTVLFRAYALLPAQQAQPLNYTWPMVLIILSIILLKQKITLRNFLAMVLGFIGVVTIATQGNLRLLRIANPEGVFLAVGSSIIWALYWIANLKDTRDEVVKLFLNFASGFIFILITNLWGSNIRLAAWPGLVGVIYIGLFEMGITFVVWLKALRFSTNTAQVGILIYLAPFLSLVFIKTIVGEFIHVSTVIGLVLIVLGIILQPKNTTVQESA